MLHEILPITATMPDLARVLKHNSIIINRKQKSIDFYHQIDTFLN